LMLGAPASVSETMLRKDGTKEAKAKDTGNDTLTFAIPVVS